MSKQDGYASRTAADLERKYNFGQTFADVYGLVADARKIAEEAQSAYDGLNQEQIFNLLTNYGDAQGIYRDDNGNVYMNASYIKSGTISGGTVKVAAAVIEGELTAATIKADKISGGTLDFSKVTAGNLEVTTAQISDLNALSITASQISGGELDFTKIVAKNLSASSINGGTITGCSLVTKVGKYNCITIDEDSFYIGDNMYLRAMDYTAECNCWGLQLANRTGLLVLGGYEGVRVYHNGSTNHYWTFEEWGLALRKSSGTIIGRITATLD